MHFVVRFSLTFIRRTAQDMLLKELFTLLLPILAIMSMVFLATNLGKRATTKRTEETIPNKHPVAYLHAPVAASCPNAFTNDRCANQTVPVMGGLDFVAYIRKSLSPSSGTIDVMGNPQFATMYNGYKFLFRSEDNMQTFVLNPKAYIPKYGGFCAWAVAGEVDVTVHPWSSDCLGPPGNHSIWSFVSDKLYFFRFEDAKTNFMSNVEQFVNAGDARWEAWFGNRSEAYFDTLCAAELSQTMHHNVNS